MNLKINKGKDHVLISYLFKNTQSLSSEDCSIREIPKIKNKKTTKIGKETMS